MSEQAVADDLPGGRKHAKNDGGDEPDAAVERGGLLLNAVHLGLVLRQHFQDVNLAGLNASDFFADVDEDGVVVLAHLENSKFSAPGAIRQTSSPVAGSTDRSTSPSLSIHLNEDSKSSMV